MGLRHFISHKESQDTEDEAVLIQTYLNRQSADCSTSWRYGKMVPLEWLPAREKAERQIWNANAFEWGYFFVLIDVNLLYITFSPAKEKIRSWVWNWLPPQQQGIDDCRNIFGWLNCFNIYISKTPRLKVLVILDNVLHMEVINVYLKKVT